MVTRLEGIHQHDQLQLSKRQQTRFNVETPAGILPELYIIKVNQFDYIAKNTLDEWIFYLKNNRVEDGFNAQGIEKARQALEVNAMSPQEQATYTAFLNDLSHE